MKLSKNKSKAFELKYQVQSALKENVADSYVYLARLDRVNRNHDFGREGYDQGAVEFRKTYCPKHFSVQKKVKKTDYVFEILSPGYYELGELIGGKVFRKMYYALKANGSWSSVTKPQVLSSLEKERETYEEKKRIQEEERQELIRQKKQQTQVKNG